MKLSENHHQQKNRIPYLSPEQSVIDKLKKSLNEKLGVRIVMGSWCSDSQREVPRFYRIMDDVGIPDEKVELISVNRDKVVPGMDISVLNIERVPTFIVYDGIKELGRIIETPVETLEKDLLRIFFPTLYIKHLTE